MYRGVNASGESSEIMSWTNVRFAGRADVMSRTWTGRTTTVNLKSSLATGGRLTLAHPLAPPGPQASGVHIYRIEAVPGDMPIHDVLKAAEYTIFVNPTKRNWTYTFDELGCGRIVQ